MTAPQAFDIRAEVSRRVFAESQVDVRTSIERKLQDRFREYIDVVGGLSIRWEHRRWSLLLNQPCPWADGFNAGADIWQLQCIVAGRGYPRH